MPPIFVPSFAKSTATQNLVIAKFQWRRSSAYEHISNFVLLVNFEKENVCWDHQDQECHALCCSILSVNKIY